jgi:hypothetical protein
VKWAGYAGIRRYARGVLAAFIYKELPGVPLWLANGLRLLQLVLGFLIVLILLQALNGRPAWPRPPWLRVVLFGQTVFALRVILSGVERWGKPLWFGGPVITIVIELTVLVAWWMRWREWRRDLRR